MGPVPFRFRRSPSLVAADSRYAPANGGTDRGGIGFALYPVWCAGDLTALFPTCALMGRASVRACDRHRRKGDGCSLASDEGAVIPAESWQDKQKICPLFEQPVEKSEDAPARRRMAALRQRPHPSARDRSASGAPSSRWANSRIDTRSRRTLAVVEKLVLRKLTARR
jgi:hypothetical protein